MKNTADDAFMAYVRSGCKPSVRVEIQCSKCVGRGERCAPTREEAEAAFRRDGWDVGRNLCHRCKGTLKSELLRASQCESIERTRRDAGQYNCGGRNADDLMRHENAWSQ